MMSTAKTSSHAAKRPMVTAAYDRKSERYFGGCRWDYIAELPEKPKSRILELGCGFGMTGAIALEQRKCGEYCGIEINSRAAHGANTRISTVIEGDVEIIGLPWPENYFDVLIMSEVLEHLVDPWEVARRLVTLLRPGGTVMASSPNVSHRSVVTQLIRGRWDLTETGIMDRTHVRWFTPSSFVQLFADAGIVADRVGSLTPLRWKARFVNALTGGRFGHLFITQIDFRGHKP